MNWDLIVGLGLFGVGVLASIVLIVREQQAGRGK